MKRKTRRQKSIIHSFISTLFFTILFIGITPFFINTFVIYSTNHRIIQLMPSHKNLESFNTHSAHLVETDAIIVLGAGVQMDGTPSAMLQDRLDAAVSTYHYLLSTHAHAVPIVITGDGGSEVESYNEIKVMRAYLLDMGIPADFILEDPIGFSTYESMYNVATTFEIKKPIIISQEYHLYRALYIAKRFDMTPYGVAASPIDYVGQESREYREFLARNKDFVQGLLKPTPTGIRPE